MKLIFADAFYFLAALSPTISTHEDERLTRELKALNVTTDWIITEVADALSKVRTPAAGRPAGGKFASLSRLGNCPVF